MSFSEIEAMVDKILLANKEKLDKIHSKEIDKEQFSLRNKKENTIYYLRKKSSKANDEEDSEVLSEEIISEARTNLGEELLEVKEKTPKSEKKPEKTYKRKRRIRVKIGKKNKVVDDKIIVPPPTDKTILDSEDFDEIVTEIEKTIGKQPSKSVDKETEDFDKKTLETQENVESPATPDVGEAEEIKVSKKRRFLKRKKEVVEIESVPEEVTKQEEAEIPSQPDADVYSSKASVIKVDHIKPTEDEEILKEEEIPALDVEEVKEAESSKKHRLLKRKKEVVDIESVPEEVTKQEEAEIPSQPDADVYSSKASVIKVDHIKPTEDEEIPKEEEIPSPELSDVEEKEIEKSAEDLGASKSKSSFFKKEKSSDDKTTDFDKRKFEQKKLANKPIFRVDNIPQKEELDEDEVRLLDDKIKEAPMKDESKLTKSQAEIKAVLLAEEHLKERVSEGLDKEKELDISIPKGVPLTDEDAEREHVFFDEEDPSFKGWTPKITEKEKDMASDLTPKGEFDIDAQKVVGELELPKEVLQTNSVKLSDLGFSEKEWEELDFYTLHEPFAYVEILRENESLDKCYFLVEVALTKEEEKLLAFIKDTMASFAIDTEELDEKGDDEYLLDMLDKSVGEYDIKISDESRKKIYYYIGKTSLGLGKIDPLLKDPNIEDISCDGANVPIFLYHRTYGSLKSNVRFDDEDELSSFVFKLAQKCGKHISIAEPMLDATMPDGSRIQMTLSDEITSNGSTFTIRKFRSDPFSPPDLVEFNTMSSEMIAYMWLAVENGINTLFAGGTASGKTTALNALTLFIPRESKIVSIEETREINLPHPNWIPGVSRSGFGEIVADRMVGEIDMYDLMKAALRQRPEYIIVGEIRGREAYVLFQAMATGHATYSTAHADSAQSLIHRLEGKPINIPRVMLQSLDIVCLHVITRVKNVRARRCKQIIEVIDIDPTTKEILTNEVFHWDPIEDKFIYSGKSYVLERIRAEKDMSREKMTEELKNRMKIVEWMNKNNVRAFRDVSKLVAQYTETPQETLKLIEKDVNK